MRYRAARGRAGGPRPDPPSPLEHALPQVAQHAVDRRHEDGSAEVERAGREDPGARGSLVVGHVRVGAGAVEHRDLGDDHRPLGEAAVAWSISIPNPPISSPISDPLRAPFPRTATGRDPPSHDERTLERAVVVRAVLRPEKRRLGTVELTPLPDAADGRTFPGDLPVDVVGGEEDQAAAEVAISLEDVVGALGDVFAVPGIDHQVVPGT